MKTNEPLKLYLEELLFELEDEYTIKREPLSINLLFEHSGLKKQKFQNLLQSEIAFHANLSSEIKAFNKYIADLKSLKFTLIPNVYNPLNAPSKYRTSAKFNKFVSTWNDGERNKSALARKSGCSRQSVYDFLSVMYEYS